MTMPSLMDAALEYLERGWSVFPLHDKRRPCVDWKQYQTERPTREQVCEWWGLYPEAMIGVALGPVSGLIRIDADGDGYAELERLGGTVPTLEFVSPSGGRGWLYQHVDGFVTKTLWTGSGDHNELRIQCQGAYTAVPPSKGYKWTDERPPAASPRWVLDYYTGLALKQLEKELRPTLRLPELAEVEAALQVIPADTYDQWIQVGMALHSSGDEYLQVWDTWSQKSPKYNAGECAVKWKTFVDGGLTTRSILYWAEAFGYRSLARHEPLTELGNARILARMGEGKIKHSDRWEWLYWDGKRWAREGAEKYVIELQKEVLEYRLNKALDAVQRLGTPSDDDADDYKRMRKSKMQTIVAIRKHEDERSFRGARALAESEPLLSCDYRKFNSDPWMLNCFNGKLDLHNGELHEHNPDDLITQLCPTEYEPQAKCPRWEQFQEEVFLGDTELIRYVQKLCGYCLTGLTVEHILPILHGSGANGKSTFVETVLRVMGPDYSSITPPHFLVTSKGNDHPTKFTTLYGKRFMADLETQDGANLDEELVKRLTGGDEIMARGMHENFWNFKPTHKLVVGTNHVPRVRGMDIAIWRRIKLIPFNKSFEGDAAKDPHLLTKLTAEKSGILNWMLEGCYMWQREGLGETSAVTNATNAYKGTQDTVYMFVSERIDRAEGSKIKVAEIASAYKGWCLSQSIDPVSAKTLRDSLEKLDIKVDVATGRYYEGIRLQ